MPNVKLGYWEFRGRAEPIRYLLHYKNVDFEDKRYQSSDRPSWLKDKFNLDLDFPNLPYYIDENVKLSQSLTILRYLGRKYELDGKTEEEKLRVSLAEQQINDFRMSYVLMAYDKNFEKLKPDLIARVPLQLKLLAKFLGDRKFLAGDSVTYVDFLAYETFDLYLYLIPNLFADFPKLKEYHERIRSLPELQSYMQSPAYVRWPIIGAHLALKRPEPKQE